MKCSIHLDGSQISTITLWVYKQHWTALYDVLFLCVLTIVLKLIINMEECVIVPYLAHILTATFINCLQQH